MRRGARGNPPQPKILTAHGPSRRTKHPLYGVGVGKSGAVTSRALYVSPAPPRFHPPLNLARKPPRSPRTNAALPASRIDRIARACGLICETRGTGENYFSGGSCADATQSLCWQVRRFHPFAACNGFNPNKRVGNDMPEVLDRARTIRRLQLLLAQSKADPERLDPAGVNLQMLTGGRLPRSWNGTLRSR